MATKVLFNPFTGRLDQVQTGAAGSDSQTLNLTGDNLTISGGNSVDLSKYIDNVEVNTVVESTTIVQNLIDGTAWDLPGPYTNEAGAGAAGVAIGQAYYDNGGTVRVRQT